MGLKFRCSGCNAKLEAEEEWAGMRIACPKCATELIVPSPARRYSPARFSGRQRLTSITSSSITTS